MSTGIPTAPPPLEPFCAAPEEEPLEDVVPPLEELLDELLLPEDEEELLPDEELLDEDELPPEELLELTIGVALTSLDCGPVPLLLSAATLK